MQKKNRTAGGIQGAGLRRVAAACLALALAACGDSLTGPSDVIGTDWRLAEMRLGGGAAQTPADPSRFRVRFESDGRIGVQADCNGCGGRYTLTGGTLQVSDLACTLVLCASAPFDAQFLGVIIDATSIEVDGDEMEISSPAGTLVFRR
jgi:heat shock protein HslJ